jgi:hypothetical protein
VRPQVTMRKETFMEYNVVPILRFTEYQMFKTNGADTSNLLHFFGHLQINQTKLFIVMLK